MSPLPSVCRWHTPALAAALLLAILPLRPAAAQITRTLTACTPDALSICTELRLSAGPSLFEFGIRTIGATGQPALPVSVYNLVFGTGGAAAVSPVTTNVGPVAIGGTTVVDASAWELFDTGDALFLSALTNFGVGGCASSTAIAGFGQAVRTCGAGQFVTFSFVPTAAFDPRRFALLNLEAVALISGLPATTCGAPGTPCVITADVATPGAPSTTVPEPTTGMLLAAGLLLTALSARVRQRGV